MHVCFAMQASVLSEAIAQKYFRTTETHKHTYILACCLWA